MIIHFIFVTAGVCNFLTNLMSLSDTSCVSLGNDSLLVRIDVSREFLYGPLVADPQTGADILYHCNVVGYDQDTALEIVESVSQSVHGLDIEVIGRFVEDENMWVCQGYAGKCNTGLLTSGKEFKFLKTGHTSNAESKGKQEKS